MLGELIQLYLDDMPNRLDGIRTAIETQDSAALRREAHRLKGSSQQMGAMRLTTLCAELENFGRNVLAAEAMSFFVHGDRESSVVCQALLQQKET